MQVEKSFINDVFEISVGTDYKNDMRYKVGHSYPKLGVRITEIIFDNNGYDLHGMTRVDIYAENLKTKEEKLWRVLFGQPSIVTGKPSLG